MSPDPLYIVQQSATERSVNQPSYLNSPEMVFSQSTHLQANEKRERKSQKFENCLLADDIDMGELLSSRLRVRSPNSVFTT